MQEHITLWLSLKLRSFTAVFIIIVVVVVVKIVHSAIWG